MNDRKGLYQRTQALKYLKRGFTVIGTSEGDEDSLEPTEHMELESNVLFTASIANSMLYIGDQLFELVSALTERESNEFGVTATETGVGAGE